MDEKKSVYMNLIKDTLIHPTSHLSSSVELKFGMGFWAQGQALLSLECNGVLSFTTGIPKVEDEQWKE